MFTGMEYIFLPENLPDSETRYMKRCMGRKNGGRGCGPQIADGKVFSAIWQGFVSAMGGM